MTTRRLLPVARTTALAAVALVASAARAAPAQARTPDPAAPPGSAWIVYPEAEVAAVKDPHQYRGGPLCQRCHRPDLALSAEPSALCRQCHTFKHGNHPVDVVQRTPAAGLPLLEGGKVACHSCHDPHRPKAPLRKPFNELCLSCHSKH